MPLPMLFFFVVHIIWINIFFLYCRYFVDCCCCYCLVVNFAYCTFREASNVEVKWRIKKSNHTEDICTAKRRENPQMTYNERKRYVHAFYHKEDTWKESMHNARHPTNVIEIADIETDFMEMPHYFNQNIKI